MKRLPLLFMGLKCLDMRFNASLVMAKMCVYAIRRYQLVKSE